MSKHFQGWVGCDLDGTLAEYTGWKGASHIGAPIKPMQMRVLRWLTAGKKVKIFTARATKESPDYEENIKAIKAWCLDHLGQELEITNQKDFAMVELWDDRAVQIIPNTGKRADGIDDLK